MCLLANAYYYCKPKSPRKTSQLLIALCSVIGASLRKPHTGWQFMLVVWAPHARQFTLHTWYLVSHMPDNLLYKHGSHCQLDEQPGIELMASNEDRLRRRRERDRIKKTDGNCKRKRSTPSTPIELEGQGQISSRCCSPSWHSML